MLKVLSSGEGGQLPGSIYPEIKARHSTQVLELVFHHRIMIFTHRGRLKSLRLEIKLTKMYFR